MERLQPQWISSPSFAVVARRWGPFLAGVTFLVRLAIAEPLLVVLCAATAMWQWAETWRYGDMVLFFLPHLVMASVIAIAASALERRRIRLVIALGLFGLNFLPMLLPTRQPAATASGTHLRLATSNVETLRPDYSSLVQWATTAQLDILGGQEVNARDLPYLTGLEAPFSTHIGTRLTSNPGTDAWSKWTVLKASLVQGADRDPVYHWGGDALRLELQSPKDPSAKITLFVLHPSSPHTRGQWVHRNHYLAQVAEAIAREPKGSNIIALGDFNTPTWSPHYRSFLMKSGLVDAQGSRWPWPTRVFDELHLPRLFGAAVDHILVSPNIKVVNLSIGPDVGSDHHPLVADVQLP